MRTEVAMKPVLAILFLGIAGMAWADPPMKTIYSDSSTTKFTWVWPYHTVQKGTSFQDKPLPNGSSLQTVFCTPDDLSRFRYHNAHLTFQNQWGYFFPLGTKPVRSNTGDWFVTLQGYLIQSH